MRKYAAAGLVLTVLLFGGAYLAAGGPAAEPEPAAPETAAVHHDRDVTLTIQDGDTTEQMTLKRYLTGVVRGEMPASFEMEALRAQAAAERVISLLETEPDIVDSPEVVAQYGDNFHPKTENWPKLIGDIDFEDVTFRYKEGEKVLEHFNLHIQHGQTIALVGETGSGKSTIVNLVCRFYEPTEGKILIDGADYRTRSQLWLQSNLGYVLQSPHLFSGTVANNIRYGRPDATDEEIEALHGGAEDEEA